jgi:hypothetical protein
MAPLPLLPPVRPGPVGVARLSVQCPLDVANGQAVEGRLLCGGRVGRGAARGVVVAIATTVVVEIPQDDVGLVVADGPLAVGVLILERLPMPLPLSPQDLGTSELRAHALADEPLNLLSLFLG